jgi:hypothetical protein
MYYRSFYRKSAAAHPELWLLAGDPACLSRYASTLQAGCH